MTLSPSVQDTVYGGKGKKARPVLTADADLWYGSPQKPPAGRLKGTGARRRQKAGYGGGSAPWESPACPPGDSGQQMWALCPKSILDMSNT